MLFIASERGRISVELDGREGNTASQKTILFCIFQSSMRRKNPIG